MRVPVYRRINVLNDRPETRFTDSSIENMPNKNIPRPARNFHSSNKLMVAYESCIMRQSLRLPLETSLHSNSATPAHFHLLCCDQAHPVCRTHFSHLLHAPNTLSLG